MEIKDEIFKLKTRIESGKDDKIDASLQRLKTLPIDLNLLLETGIGKAVNKLRHHEKYGNTARKLVTKWKESAHEIAEREGIELTVDNNLNNGYAKPDKQNSKQEDKHKKGFGSSTSSKGGSQNDDNNKVNKPSKPKSLLVNDNFETHQSSKAVPARTSTKEHKTVASRSLKEEKFTSNCGSFEDVLGLNDRVSVTTKPTSSNKTVDTVKRQQVSSKREVDKEKGRKQHNEVAVEADERRNSFDDIDWSTVLPKTVPEYRPQHLPPDYSEYTANNGKKRSAETAFDETDQNLFSSKKDRNKVFSGRRTAYLSKVPSLYDSCIRVLCDNIDGLGFTGGVPYDILKPILERASAEQLFRIEDLNPYLVEDTDGLWYSLCKKDFRNAEREELESWREVYERLLIEREKKLEKVKSSITASKIASGPVRQAKIALAKAPRDVRRRQIKYGTARQAVPTVEEIVQSRRNIDAHPEDRTKIVCRPASAHYEAEVAQKKKKPTVAPLMAKTLKMLKMARR